MIDQKTILNLGQRLARDRTGASAFEFALVLPLFVLMLGGIIQYGVLFYTWNMALYGARNAARAVAVGSADVAGGKTMMRDALPPWVTSSSGGDRNCGGGNGDAGDIGGYGPGGCGAGNGNGNGNGGGSGGGGDDIVTEVTDAAVGGDVVARMEFPSRRATVLPLAPMPATLSVTVRMVKEA
ncbi:TadE/TadG family type IV pilus assembly protein [Sandarakinorhabdus oryzae]|uniref:TadE/TadG family type IV pilus assembly protein n=1 Tax=Sandarakinorhabdus oryzae TaxID=2675220 RepID=UPI0012E2E788|nr:TadE/TadG family type IV pilus assembly protein [Sandarakinorhabdus oryzae]